MTQQKESFEMTERDQTSDPTQQAAIFPSSVPSHVHESQQTDPPRRESQQTDPPRRESQQTDPPRRESQQTDPPRRESQQTDPPRRNICPLICCVPKCHPSKCACPSSVCCTKKPTTQDQKPPELVPTTSNWASMLGVSAAFIGIGVAVVTILVALFVIMWAYSFIQFDEMRGDFGKMAKTLEEMRRNASFNG
ncbi:hypothetical protein ACQ4LE_008121 [Meloidogyne hapla]